MSKNQHAVALGRRNKGIKKTMTEAAIKQRREALEKANLAREQRISSEKVKIIENKP